jgi:predicted RND superfamily exporter protein
MAQGRSGPELALRADMNAAMDALIFTLDRVRNILLVLALIVLLKAAWVILVPAFAQP